MLHLAFREQTLGTDTHFLVVSKLQSGVACSADCSGCPLTSKRKKQVHQVKELVLKNRRIITFEVANMEKYNIWVSSEHFQKQSAYVQITIKFIPYLPSMKQKESHVRIC
jgi:hypothetical protein